MVKSDSDLFNIEYILEHCLQQLQQVGGEHYTLHIFCILTNIYLNTKSQQEDRKKTDYIQNTCSFLGDVVSATVEMFVTEYRLNVSM